MTPLGLTVLRRTATLAHAVPGLRVRLRHDGSALLEVLRPAHPVVAPTGRWLTPCAFRVAVGRAVAAAHAGRTLAVLGLEPGTDPAVDIGAVTGRLLPGAIALVPAGASHELAFATTVDAALVGELAAGEHLDVSCHPDPLTEAALVVTTTAAPPASPEFDHHLERTQALLARAAVHELLDGLDQFRVGGAAVQRPQDRPPRP
jgi:hypothetical protein